MLCKGYNRRIIIFLLLCLLARRMYRDYPPNSRMVWIAESSLQLWWWRWTIMVHFWSPGVYADDDRRRRRYLARAVVVRKASIMMTKKARSCPVLETGEPQSNLHHQKEMSFPLSDDKILWADGGRFSNQWRCGAAASSSSSWTRTFVNGRETWAAGIMPLACGRPHHHHHRRHVEHERNAAHYMIWAWRCLP
jgi:hypothetical protein